MSDNKNDWPKLPSNFNGSYEMATKAVADFENYNISQNGGPICREPLKIMLMQAYAYAKPVWQKKTPKK